MIEEEYDAFNFAFFAGSPYFYHYYNRPLQSLLISLKMRSSGCKATSTDNLNECTCLQRYKTEPVYRRKNEPPPARFFSSLFSEILTV